MSYINLENYLRTLTFICLFITMLFYWIQTAFFSTNSSNKFEIFTLFISNFFLSLILIIRWIESKHFPLSNLYESLIFLCWGLTIFLLFLEVRIKINYIGVLISPIILFTNTFATFSLPADMQKASSLVPALQSNWLMMHVTIMMLSYAALIFGSLLSIAYLVLNYSFNLEKTNLSLILENRTFNSNINFLIKNEILEKKVNSKEQEANKNQNFIIIDNLDNLSYRTLGIGFPLLTVGILSGAVWANETWGSYWSWDPKETWALITWFIYAIYLHSRIIKGWKGTKPAFIASFGFLSVWICYLGVNLFGKGLHSYGWFDLT